MSYLKITRAFFQKIKKKKGTPIETTRVLQFPCKPIAENGVVLQLAHRRSGISDFSGLSPQKPCRFSKNQYSLWFGLVCIESMASPSSSSSSSLMVTERRGIPGAQFVEDVQTYLTQLGLDVNSALAFLQERSVNPLQFPLLA